MAFDLCTALPLLANLSYNNYTLKG